MHLFEMDSQSRMKPETNHSQAVNINFRIRMLTFLPSMSFGNGNEGESLLFQNHDTAQYLDALNGLINGFPASNFKVRFSKLC